MESIINVQKDVQRSIERSLINFKKCPKDRCTAEYIEAKIDNLEKDWTLFRKNNSRLYESYKNRELEDSEYIKNDMYANTEESYLVAKSHIKSSIKSSAIVASSNPGYSSSLAKLPKITIPTFSGKYEEWTTFKDLFVSLVHSNKSLDNVQKLHYLKGQLTGEAELLIRHMPIADSNYDRCWELLESRYSNKRFLSNAIFNKLFGQRSMKFESATSIKELIDTTSDCLSALKALEVDVSTWDIIIIHIVSSKLDTETRKQWELNVSNVSNSENELPTFAQFKTFLESRFRALEFIEPIKRSVTQHGSGSQTSCRSMVATSESVTDEVRSMVATSESMPCEFCSDNHKLSYCKAFAKQDVSERRAFVSKNRMCFNCLGGNHNVYSCKKPTICRICKRRHHTLLHLTPEDFNANKQVVTKPTTNEGQVESKTTSESDQVVACLSTGDVPMTKQVLLATALIKAEAVTGEYQTVRALMDQGSQACFITEAAVQLLRLKKTPVKGTISGLGNDIKIPAKYVVQTTIQSRTDPEFKMEVQAYVLGHITSYLPEKHVEKMEWLDIETVQLADPQFATPRKIDMLLGADVYSQVLKQGMKKSASGKLVAQSTSLGWILSGVVTSANTTQKEISVMHVSCIENEALKRFWEIEEELSTKKLLTKEEQKCEDFFKRTTKREADRYIVKLPFKDEEPQCKYGNSRDIAVKRLVSLEKRLSRDTVLKEQYTDVINEYMSSNHMRPVKENDDRKHEAVYLPHHAVVRNDKETTKVRVVYDASSPNSKGVSLNDTLLVGPTLQSDLRHTILRWRVHNIALVADIIKMYRQVRVDEENAIYQRIVWRDDPGKRIQDYELMTVTFGTASAPYLAVRTMHQVAYDEGENYPLAVDKVLNCFYMDDLMTGCSTVEEGVNLYRQIVGLLGKGGFRLQKWNSNNRELLKQINKYENTEKYKIEQTEEEDRTNEDNIEMKLDTTIKILGLTWNRSEDIFQYKVQLPSSSGPITKRKIISDIARIFDPLGWIAPAVILAKMMIQKLWLSGIGWDEAVPTELLEEWKTYHTELPQLTTVKIPRWLGMTTDDVDVEMHGFCDASKLAYAAVIYLRVCKLNGDIQTTLLVAKTRVAPIKQISIPRLELCGAVLLARLINEAIEVTGIPKEKVRAWTDSTIVLAWLNSHPNKWKTFVANRVSEIISTLDSSQWWHVVSQDNPADCASRGVQPSALSENDLWLNGPQFLRDQIINYSRPKNINVQLEENVKAHVTTVPENAMFQRFSSLPRLLRVIAYCRRFLRSNKVKTQYIQKKEIEEALECCIRQTQEEEFLEEKRQLQANECLKSKTSKLKSLSPYLDDKGIMRVSGRIQNSQLSEQTKHPIILPHGSHLSKLIVNDAHQNTLHGGSQLMENYLRTGYWIIGVKSLVKQHIRKCVTCVRENATVKTQYMGSLPAVRCTPVRAFKHSGVDYAGPIQIRTSKGRGNHSYKGYICLFICMVTRAIHLEAVSDMTTSTFLSAFRRFVSRRGHCSQIWSDNGTTFVGASKELEQLNAIQQESAARLEANGTQWHFIPPRAPNFGGLWEAGVKSTKFHLKRVIGDSTLTFEEMSTLLSQVEACLNSRPLTVINSTEPGEPLPLTPGHFLVGEPLVSLPGVDFESSNISSLSRWQLVQKMFQSFWRRWSQDYLTSLVHRYKWIDQVPEPCVNDVVLIKEDDQPPSRWLLGRVMEKHPGPDGLTRVVTLRTNKNVIKRPTSKLCVLPID